VSELKLNAIAGGWDANTLSQYFHERECASGMAIIGVPQPIIAGMVVTEYEKPRRRFPQHENAQRKGNKAYSPLRWRAGS